MTAPVPIMSMTQARWVQDVAMQLPQDLRHRFRELVDCHLARLPSIETIMRDFDGNRTSMPMATDDAVRLAIHRALDDVKRRAA